MKRIARLFRSVNDWSLESAVDDVQEQMIEFERQNPRLSVVETKPFTEIKRFHPEGPHDRYKYRNTCVMTIIYESPDG